MQRVIIFFDFIIFLLIPIYAEASIEEFLCDLARQYYQKGDYSQALHEYNKALILNPDNEEAKTFVSEFKSKGISAEKVFNPRVSPSRSENIEQSISRNLEINKALLDTQKKIGTNQVLEKKEEESLVSRLKEEKPRIEEEKAQIKEVSPVKITGEAVASLGFTADDTYWKRANADLNEREWRLANGNALNRRDNTYDPGIYDRLRVNVDTQNSDGLNLHSNITVDPWSFTGKSDKINLKSGTDSVDLELLYWSNSGYTVNQTINTLGKGIYFNLPEIKVNHGRVLQTQVKSDANNLSETFLIPETEIKRDFWPLREIWFDYKTDDAFNFRFFPMAYQDQALTSDDPLGLSNHHMWWEESPWLDGWKKGNLNTALSPQEFTKGEWDDSLSFYTRDSDGKRLTALRGLSFNWMPTTETSLLGTLASPKTLWQDYDRFDALPGAIRLKQLVSDNFNLGGIYTFRLGFNKNKRDATDQVAGVDFAFAPVGGLKISAEAAQSLSDQDRTSSYRTKKRGNAFYLSLLSDSSGQDILDFNYDQIKPKKNENTFLKFRFFGVHMDSGFDPGLSTYRETRDDSFWGRHIRFRMSPAYYSSGVFSSGITVDDIMPFKIGDSVDTGRDVLGLRAETNLWEGRLEGLGDIRNAHYTNGKYLETVSRTEWTYKFNPKLTTKLLALNHDLPKTKGGLDPFVSDTDLDIPLINTAIPDGEDPSLNTASFGLEYKLWDWLSWDGVYEHTNDFTVAENNFPREIFNDKGFTTYTQDGLKFRRRNPFLYDQTVFPAPPYEYEDILRSGLRFMPVDKLDVYLDYAHSGFEFAGPIDDNMNHIGLELLFMPTDKMGLAFEYTYSKFWDDFVSREIVGHHNFFTQFRRKLIHNDEFIFEYGVGSYTPFGTGAMDPLGGGTLTLDTQHILRIFYNKKF